MVLSAPHNHQQWLQSRLDEYQQKQLYRKVNSLTSAQGTQVSTSSGQLINFSSNDYLSLANHPEVVAGLIDAAQKYGVGSGASHLICGHHEAHEELQEAIATWTGREAAILFSSGYMANMAILTALMDKDDLIVHDKLNHASLIDGALASKATQKRFQHKNFESLLQQLSGEFRYKWLVTDGVFSMDGDIAPLPDYIEAFDATGSQLPLMVVDDAHGLGVLGESGAGTLEHFQLTAKQVPVLMGTLGKAVGTSGAFVAGDQLLIDNLIQFARQFIYTTAMPPAIARSSVIAIQMIRKDRSLRDQLQQNILYFCERARDLGIPLLPSQTAIQLVLINVEATCMTMAENLKQQGFWVGAIRPPTVPKGSARLRITLNREHSQSQIDELLLALKKQLQELAPRLLTRS